MIHEHDFHEDFFSCGCRLEVCDICKCAHSLEKCKLHQNQGYSSQCYYLQELHGVQEGIPRHMHIVAEYQTALIHMGVEIPRAPKYPARVLDIGCGIGYFAPFFANLGYQYEGLEMDTWAARYVRSAYMVPAHNCCYEDFNVDVQWHAVMASHVVEHFEDAAGMLQKIYDSLEPGGRFYGILPEGTDWGNPDHLWFFMEETVHQWFAEIGFVGVRTHMTNVVPFERFIYFVAEKPLTKDPEPDTIQVDS